MRRKISKSNETQALKNAQIKFVEIVFKSESEQEYN